MYSFLVDDSSGHRKAKGINKNVVERISHNEYKNVLLNKKCLRLAMNRSQSIFFEHPVVYNIYYNNLQTAYYII